MEIWCTQCNKPVDSFNRLDKRDFPRIYSADEPPTGFEILVHYHGRSTWLQESVVLEQEQFGDGLRLFAFFDSEELDEIDNPD